ncbi:MAG: hypothetical protein ACFFDW_08415, partial [Candidatus Thorarchaeota archaeon]
VEITMILTGGNTYQAIIGSFAGGGTVDFYITAIDSSPNSNSITDDNDGHYYGFNIMVEPIPTSNPTPTPSTTPTNDSPIAFYITILAIIGLALFRSLRKKH